MIKAAAFLSLLMLAVASLARADEQTRQVQEELRKRNLYFGDIDGKVSPDLTNSLKHYQKRKGFAESGKIDAMTAASLNVVGGAIAANDQVLPDIPVLRSDRAPSLPVTERVALQEKADGDPDAMPSPPPPAEAPQPAGNVTPARVRQLIEEYLREGEGNDVAAQARFFSNPVEYFKDGKQDAKHVSQDIASYVKDWPERHYELGEPVTFFAAEKDAETIIEFPITYRVRNEGRVKGKRYEAQGRTKNTWVIRPEGDELKIVAIREERLRN